MLYTAAIEYANEDNVDPKAFAIDPPLTDEEIAKFERMLLNNREMIQQAKLSGKQIEFYMPFD